MTKADVIEKLDQLRALWRAESEGDTRCRSTWNWNDPTSEKRWLRAADDFLESLIAADDPELAWFAVRKGFRIYHLPFRVSTKSFPVFILKFRPFFGDITRFDAEEPCEEKE